MYPIIYKKTKNMYLFLQYIKIKTNYKKITENN